MAGRIDGFDFRGWMKQFAPALLALVLALTAWINNKIEIDSNQESRVKSEVEFSTRLSQVELQTAELKGEQKSQRELLTELRLDIREIKTLLENIVMEKRSTQEINRIKGR